MIDKQIIYVILGIILIGIVIYIFYDSCKCNKIEGLTMNYLDEPELLLLQRYNEDQDDDDITDPSQEKIHKNTLNYFKVSDFTELVLVIKEKISDMLVKDGEVCRGQAGFDLVGDGVHMLSLNCYTNPQELEDTILMEVFKIIHKTVMSKYGINLNFHAVMFELYNHLNLLEKVIYPLMYSELYTVNGIQYTTETKIRDMVNQNLQLHDVLYTIISKRGIVMDMDTDKNIQYIDPKFNNETK